MFPGGSHQIEALIMQHLWSVMTELTQGREGLLYPLPTTSHFNIIGSDFFLSLFLISVIDLKTKPDIHR